MNFFQAIFLGAVQGITEFVPVSSSGHLVVLPQLLRWPEPGMFFDVVLHAGTLMALLLYFYKDLLKIAVAVVKNDRTNGDAQLGWFLLIGTIPAIIGALVFNNLIENLFTDARWVGIFWLVTGAVFVITAKWLKSSGKKEKADLRDAVLIGIAQMIALLPGVSRSGSTTWAGTRLGLTHQSAARFAFLLGIPAIFAATAKTFYDVYKTHGLATIDIGILLTGLAVSALVGVFVIRWVLTYFQKHTLLPFGIYMIVAGLTVLLLLPA
jgi:undecaprenyl-diphosphatase